MKYISEKDKLAYEYISSDHGIKENIILDEVPKSNIFSFSLELEGLVAKKDTCVEGISFFNKDEDIVGGIQIPFMNDATGKAYSEEITYTLTDLGDGKYIVDMTVSEEYLKDEKREYPVTIDPTVTWTGTSYMYDTYVANNSYKDENFYSSSVTLLRAGMLPSGSAVTRSLVHWPKIPSTVNDKYISSAKLSLYETGSGAASMKVRAYRVLTAWNKSTVTWNTQPTIDTSCYATLTTKGTAGSANTVSVKTFVQDIANESKSNYGLMLRNTNESSTAKYVGYYNSRYTANASYKPKMVIVYADRPSRPTSVTAASSYIKKGASLTVGWEGISSSSLSYVQYKVVEYNPDTKEFGDTVIPYSSSTKIGTTASGSKTITAVNTLPEGYYKIGVRGVDSNGIVGVGASKSFVIDGTVPTISSASITPSGTSTTNYAVTAPTITWSASDKYFYDMQISVDGAAYERISTSTSGSASLEDYITEAGKHVISLRARDKASNVSALKTFTYYYDETMPEVESAISFYDAENNKATVRIDEVSCGLAGFSGKVKYAINKDSDSAITDVSKLTKEANITYSDKTGKFSLSNEDLSINDGIYNIYMSISDKSGHNSEICSTQLIKFKNATYDGDETLSAEYDKDKNVVTLSWNEDSNIKSVDLYSRYGEDGLFKFDQTVTDAYKVNIATSKIESQADYRLVVKYEDKQKLSSAVTVIKSEEENEDGTTTTSYEMDIIDTDEDGIIDIYEMWEFGTDYENVDSDGDSFKDGYEVMSLGTSPSTVTEDEDYDEDGVITSEEIKKGTHPYLADSDFDGYNDDVDDNPIKTDVSNQSNASYTTDVNKGKYDREISETDEDGNTTSYITNIYSGVTKQTTDGLGNKIAYYYDDNNNNTAVVGDTDKEYYANIYTYNDDNEMTYLAHNGFGYSFDYDDNGNLIKVSAADRVLVTNSYKTVTTADEEGNEDTSYITDGITYGNGNKYSYTYDSDNENITGITIDGTLAYEMTYDEEDNLTKQVDNINNVTYTYEYDEDGNTTAIKGSDGFNILYSDTETTSDGTTTNKGEIKYTVGSDVQKVISYESSSTDSSINSTTVLIDGSKIKYVANDNKDTETTTITNTEDKTVVTYSTVKDGRTTTLTNTAGEANVYTFDKNNNIKSITKDDKEVASYKYDGLEQLVRENDAVANKTYVYQYDKGGNIVSKKVYDYTTEDTISTEATDTITYKYEDSSWKDLLTSYDGQEITYDASGNPLQYRDGINFTWKYGRSLASTTLKDGTNISYEYNQDGIRTSKTINNTTTKYQLEGNDIVKETTGDDEIWYLYDESNQLYGLIINGKSYYYEKNLQGDIVGLFDKDGKEVVTYSYDAWGNVTKVTGDDELAKQNPFRYRSYYYYEELEMYYLQSRYYDSEAGRFINADDVNVLEDIKGNVKGSNLYEYVKNNPVNYKDPTGKWLANVLSGVAVGTIFGLLANIVCKILNIKGKAKAKIVSSCALIAGVIGAFLGPKFLAQKAPRLLKALKQIEKKKLSIKKMGPNGGGNIFGINISDTLIIMLHKPHPGKKEWAFHIQVEVKLKGCRQRTIWKKDVLKVNPNKWR
mgnify:CR=1 FL=1